MGSPLVKSSQYASKRSKFSKCGSLNSFFSAERLRFSSTPGFRNSVYSEARPLSDSSGGSSRGADASVGAAPATVFATAPAAGAGAEDGFGPAGFSSVLRASLLRRDQRETKFSLSSAIIALCTLEGRRPGAPLRLRLVVALDVLREPRDPLRRHRHAVHARPGIEHARRLVVAHRDSLGNTRAFFFEPVHEHERLVRGEIEVVAFRLIVKKLQLEARMQPLRARFVLHQRARRRAGLARIRYDADRFPLLRLPALVRERRALHHNCDGEAGLRHFSGYTHQFSKRQIMNRIS